MTKKPNAGQSWKIIRGSLLFGFFLLGIFSLYIVIIMSDHSKTSIDILQPSDSCANEVHSSLAEDIYITDQLTHMNETDGRYGPEITNNSLEGRDKNPEANRVPEKDKTNCSFGKYELHGEMQYNRKPLKGVRIRIRGMTATTDDNGLYSIITSKKGVYAAVIYPNETRFTVPFRIKVRIPGPLSLELPTGSIYGKVVLPIGYRKNGKREYASIEISNIRRLRCWPKNIDGNPIAPSIFPGGSASYHVLTGESFKFEHLFPGQYEINASYPGYAFKGIKTRIDGQTENVEIYMKRAGSIRVVVAENIEIGEDYYIEITEMDAADPYWSELTAKGERTFFGGDILPGEYNVELKEVSVPLDKLIAVKDHVAIYAGVTTEVFLAEATEMKDCEKKPSGREQKDPKDE